MKSKIFFSLIFCSIINIFNINSQNTYPKKLIIDNDEVIAITPPQLSIINGVFVERDGLKVEIDSLNSIVKNYHELSNIMKSQSISKDSIISKQYSLLDIKNIIIEEQSLNISDLKSKDKKNKRLMKLYLGTGITLSIAGILAILIN